MVRFIPFERTPYCCDLLWIYPVDVNNPGSCIVADGDYVVDRIDESPLNYWKNHSVFSSDIKEPCQCRNGVACRGISDKVVERRDLWRRAEVAIPQVPIRQ